MLWCVQLTPHDLRRKNAYSWLKECQHLRSSLVAFSYLCVAGLHSCGWCYFFRSGFLLINQFVHFMLDKFTKLMVVVDDDVTRKPLSFRFPSELQAVPFVPFVPMIPIFHSISGPLSHSHVLLISQNWWFYLMVHRFRISTSNYQCFFFILFFSFSRQATIAMICNRKTIYSSLSMCDVMTHTV